MTGYSLRDELNDKDADRDIEMDSKMSATLYPAWTYWANGQGQNQGHQDLETTIEMIKNSLEAKGYTAQPE